MGIKIRDLQSRAKQLAHNLNQQKKRLQKDKNRNEKELTDLSDLESKLVTTKGRYQQPKLLAQLNYLAYMLKAADQRPGKDAYDRYEELKIQLESLIVEVQEFTSD